MGLSGNDTGVSRFIMMGELLGCIVAAHYVIFSIVFIAHGSPLLSNPPPVRRAPLPHRCTSHHLQVQEIKKIQNKGGTCLGEANPTWLKQPGDMGVALAGAGLTAFGTINCIVGHYRLATGKGKLD